MSSLEHILFSNVLPKWGSASTKARARGRVRSVRGAYGPYKCYTEFRKGLVRRGDCEEHGHVVADGGGEYEQVPDGVVVGEAFGHIEHGAQGV